MSLQSLMFRCKAGKSDRKRDAIIPLPAGITECRNIAYGPYGKSNLLDVYYPNGTGTPLPTIVSIHGGGYVYGSKELYRRYCMDLARRGFAVVNFNYRLAPKWKFPSPLEDTNAVLHWVHKNARRYFLDPGRIVLIGDSAGAQLASQYAAIFTNPDYAKGFSFSVPPIRLRALGLNCGMYDLRRRAREGGQMIRDYLGPHPQVHGARLDVLSQIGPAYPPAYFLSAAGDFLAGECVPSARLFASRGVETAYRIYGTRGDPSAGHVFHVNPALALAKQANDDEIAFFRRFLR